MVIRGTPIDKTKYIEVDNDDMIYKLSVKHIFPKYIDNNKAYFDKQDVTLDIINEIIQKGW